MSSALANFLFQNGCEDRAVTERYLRMLTKEDWQKLLELYKEDITLFGYEDDVENIEKLIFQ